MNFGTGYYGVPGGFGGMVHVMTVAAENAELGEAVREVVRRLTETG